MILKIGKFSARKLIRQINFYLSKVVSWQISIFNLDKIHKITFYSHMKALYTFVAYYTQLNKKLIRCDETICCLFFFFILPFLFFNVLFNGN